MRVSVPWRSSARCLADDFKGAIYESCTIFFFFLFRFLLLHSFVYVFFNLFLLPPSRICNSYWVSLSHSLFYLLACFCVMRECARTLNAEAASVKRNSIFARFTRLLLLLLGFAAVVCYACLSCRPACLPGGSTGWLVGAAHVPLVPNPHRYYTLSTFSHKSPTTPCDPSQSSATSAQPPSKPNTSPTPA